MSEHTDQIAAMYRNLAGLPVYKHLEDIVKQEADSRRRNAGKLEPTQSWGELKFADGLEWVLTHIKQQQVIDKMDR